MLINRTSAIREQDFRLKTHESPLYYGKSDGHLDGHKVSQVGLDL